MRLANYMTFKLAKEMFLFKTSYNFPEIAILYEIYSGKRDGFI